MKLKVSRTKKNLSNDSKILTIFKFKLLFEDFEILLFKQFFYSILA